MSKWNPEQRARVKARTNGACAYCGTPLGDKFHVDHIRSINSHRQAGEGRWDREINMHAACEPCNLYKSDLSLEDFRAKIGKAHSRLLEHAGYRAMMRYGVVPPCEPYVFYFETLTPF